MTQGPHPRKARWNAGEQRVAIDFAFVGAGLSLNSGTAPKEFRVRCADDAVYDCRVELDDGDGRVVSATLEIHVVPANSLSMVGWERGWNGRPDHKVAGAAFSESR